MKIKDAIHWIDIARMGYICDPNECGLEKGGDPCKVFHCDEIHDALVMAMDTLEKQIPKKPKMINRTKHYCPKCYNNNEYFPVDNKFFGVEISEEHRKEVRRVTYCKHCGQAIDWSEVE